MIAIPPNDSPFWPILRLVTVACVAIVAVSVGYREGWVTRADLPVVLAIAGALAGVEGLSMLAKRGD